MGLEVLGFLLKLFAERDAVCGGGVEGGCDSRRIDLVLANL
jgi:hypothetical protein